MLEANDEVVGIPHDDHVARGLAPSPAFGPEVEDVMQVDVGKQRRDYRALPSPPLTDRCDPVFQDARLQPFLDQADDAPVADAMFQEADQPLLADFVKERSDVGVQYPVHLRALDPDNERIQRVMRAAPGSESVREPEEVFLVDRVEHRNSRPLDDLVFQSGNRERALPAVSFGNVDPPRRQCPICSPMDASMQVLEVALEILLVTSPGQAIYTRCGVFLKFEERLVEQIDADVVEE